MAWTSPRTWVAGEQVTASLMNTYIRDDFSYLKDAPTFDGAVTVTGALAVTSTSTLTGLATLTAGFTTAANSTIIGTGSGGDNLIVQTATTNPPGITLKNTTTGNLAQIVGTNALGLNLNVNTGTTFGLEIASTGIWRGRAYGAGTATFDANGIVSSVSDERLKIIEGDFARGLADLLKIKPIRYRWNDVELDHDREHEYAGFSAQNVQQAIPEAVFDVPDGYLSLQDRPILAALVNAVQELHARLTELESADGA